MMTNGVAWRYASALFDLAKEENSAPAITEALNGLARSINVSPDLQRLFASPIFRTADQMAAIEALAAKVGLNGQALNFVKLLCVKRRLAALPAAIAAFQEQVAAERGEVSAEVISAEKLSPAQMKDLAAALKLRLGKDVRLNTKVDSSILGGLSVKIGSTLIDDSLKTKLQKLKIAMKGTG